MTSLNSSDNFSSSRANSVRASITDELLYIIILSDDNTALGTFRSPSHVGSGGFGSPVLHSRCFAKSCNARVETYHYVADVVAVALEYPVLPPPLILIRFEPIDHRRIQYYISCLERLDR